MSMVLGYADTTCTCLQVPNEGQLPTPMSDHHLESCWVYEYMHVVTGAMQPACVVAVCAGGGVGGRPSPPLRARTLRVAAYYQLSYSRACM